MKLAILGTRGVPPAYGGFETFAAELGARLVSRGHDVTVYCRSISAKGEEPLEWRGIRRIVLPHLSGKYFETISHTLLSAVDALGRQFDAVLVCNAANAFTLPLLRAARIPVAINVDGVERKRRKWNFLGRAVYAAGEAFSVAFASALIADAEVIASYYRSHYAIEPITIPYGAEFPVEADSDVLGRLGLQARGYLLYVSRFEPENNPLEVVRAYETAARSTSSLPPLVMVGQGLYAPDLVRELHQHESDSVRFPGALYGVDYRTLQRNALVYLQATEVGGTHPALIEAMASGGSVLANATPENLEVGGSDIGYFHLRPDETLSAVLVQCLTGDAIGDEARRRTRQRAAERFGWERVTDSHERLFRKLVGQ